MLKTNHGKKLLSKALAASILLSALAFTACKNEKKLTASSTLSTAESSDKVPAKLKKISEETKSYLADKNIVVVLGYGYNDEENVTKITQNLNENFGVETEDKKALITVLVYPADFMVAGKERISSLADRIEDKNLAGMIVLGAPEGLHIALSKIQDKNEDGKIHYPVFTFFSQDDVLGSESTSDFVLDYAHKTDFIPDFDATNILTNSLSKMLELREPLRADGNLINFVQSLLEKNRTVVRYIDGETGLQSINHFIFE